MPESVPASVPVWHHGVTRYQWLVLAIACAGWVFDVFDGQLFTVYKTAVMSDLLGPGASASEIDRMANYGLASFLAGGAFGGLLFGMLADRAGRRSAMVWSILFYSVFTGLHFFARGPWDVIVLRFFVAMGVGGEWAVAAALVSEVFPQRARAAAGAIFHASSVLGVALAALCDIGLDLAIPAGSTVPEWRIAFLLGLTPALLILWVRSSLRESDQWNAARAPSSSEPSGAALAVPVGLDSNPLSGLFREWQTARNVLLGLSLATVGLSTYWGSFAWGPELVKEVLGASVSPAEQSWLASTVFLLMNVVGALAGLLSFAPVASRFGCRTAFAVYHAGGLITVPLAFLGASTFWQCVLLLLPMSFFVVGLHAGYAIYFPELFPTRLRATGTSLCFNGGRICAAVMLLVRIELRESMGLRMAVSVMATLFLVGLFLLPFAQETNRPSNADQPGT